MTIYSTFQVIRFKKQQEKFQEQVAEADAAMEEVNAGLEESNAGLEGANAGLEEANAGLEGANAGLEEANAGLEEANACLEVANAALDEAKAVMEEKKKALIDAQIDKDAADAAAASAQVDKDAADAAAASIATMVSEAEEYLNGEKERRTEGILNDVECKCYLLRYPDLRAGFGTDPIQAYDHWKNCGLGEDRDGSAPCELNDDLAILYVERYDDLEDIEAAKEHWLNEGYKDRDIPAPTISEAQAKCYLAAYPDLEEAMGDDIEDAQKHWEEYGYSEKRDFPQPLTPYMA